ncbi:MAG: SUMF1/EgtB/PvdO family nonheme iron enzyme [Crocinitomicaceae bacterium]
MKQIVIILIVFSLNLVFGQKAMKIISPAIKMESDEWYNEQMKLWKAKIDAEPSNEEAWYNYFRACNYSRSCGRDELIEIAEDANKAIPQSFSYYYMMNKLTSGNNSYLDSAYAKDPSNTDIWEGLLVRAITNGDKANEVLFAEKLFNSDEEDISLYHWGYNILSSLEQNAILFTHGDNDTFGAWILQAAKNIRTDAHVVNTSLLMDSTYCNRYWKLFVPNEKWVSIQNYYTDNKVDWDNGHAYIQFLMKKFAESGRAIHMTVATPDYYKSEFEEEDLILTGLTFKYDPSHKTSSIASLIKNFESVYKLEYVEQRYFSNIWDNKAKNMAKTYLTGLIKLYVHYQQTGNTEKEAWAKHLIQIIEPNPITLGIYGDFIESETGVKPIEFNGLWIKTKNYFKKFSQLSENLYASNMEETNWEYRIFLDDLKENNPKAYEKFRPDSTLFTKSYKEAFLEPMERMYHWHPAYDEYPVVNISKEAATEYCKWLTSQWNNDPKRKFDKVEFILPTEDQWEMASGEPQQIQNAEGCYVINGYLKDKDGRRYYDDGGFFMVKVDSYNPNSTGLYNTYGNVCEMISDKSQTKGGGWDTEYNDFKKSSHFQSAPHPTVGFRVFMKVIQK